MKLAGWIGSVAGLADAPRPVAALVMLLAGAVHTAAFAPVGAWPLQLMALAVLALACSRAGPARAAWLGGWFSVGWLVSGLWWLFISMHDFGGMSAPLAAGAVLLLAAALSVYLALAMAMLARLRCGRPLPDGLLFVACWLLAELARGQWFTGFPWIASGYAHTDGPLAAWAPWIGVYGITGACALVAAALAQVLQPARHSPALIGLALAVVVVGLGGPIEFTRSSGALSVSLLQPNVPQNLKFDPERVGTHMAELQQQLHAATGALVLTPESVLPVPQADLDPAWWAALVAPYSDGGQAALIGTFLGDERSGYVNSMVGVSARQGVATERFYRYGKRHLLPFGEYLPLGFRWFVELLQIPLGDQASGQSEVAFEAGGQRVRPLICYEDLFGEEFAGSLVGPEAATVLANASNLAWFGRWMMQDQHLQFSRMRALEFQRPLVRATNTGATAVIDHHGVILARLPPLIHGTLDASIDGRLGATPYARWVSALGLWPLWALALLVLLGVGRLGPPARPGA